MTKSIFFKILLVLSITSFNLLGQHVKKNKNQITDSSNFTKITTLENDVYIVQLISENEEIIKFSYPLNSIEHSMSMKFISSIKYPNGTLKELEVKKYNKELDEDHWESVEHTFDEEKVEGLFKVDEYYIKYESSKLRYDSKVLEKSAIIILKRKAVRENVDIVYIKEKKLNKAYGELPYIELWGVGYTYVD